MVPALFPAGPVVAPVQGGFLLDLTVRGASAQADGAAPAGALSKESPDETLRMLVRRADSSFFVTLRRAIPEAPEK